MSGLLFPKSSDGAGLRRRVGADAVRRSTRQTRLAAPAKTVDESFEAHELHAQAGVFFDERLHDVGGNHEIGALWVPLAERGEVSGVEVRARCLALDGNRPERPRSKRNHDFE